MTELYEVLALIQTVPEFSEAQKWVANNGLATVFSIMLLLLLGELMRRLTTHLFSRIEYAITHFTTQLAHISDRQVEAIRDASQQQVESNRELATVIRGMTNVLNQVVEGQHMMMMFISHTSENIAAHRATVEPTIHIEGAPPPPATGVIKPVTYDPDLTPSEDLEQ